MKRNLIFVGLIVFTTLIIAVSYIGASRDNQLIDSAKNSETLGTDGQVNQQNEDEAKDEVPSSFNGLLIGLDKSEELTDVLMVGCVDTVNNKINVISIPRDLIIDFRDDEFKDIKANNPNNHILYCKLTEVYNLTGQNDRALKDLEEIISIITGLKIDHMARIDVDGFSDLVDAVGGVEFDVPQRMYHIDPYQDLYINLQPGPQLLDGDKAEQLVRFRDYTMGDLQRIDVQHQFIVALYDKIRSTNDLSQIQQLANSGFKMFKADFGLLFAMDYVNYFYNLDLTNILTTDHMATIPSYGEQIDGIWYQSWNIDEAHQVVNDLLNQ